MRYAQSVLGCNLTGIILLGCFAHVRPNFLRVIDARGKPAKNEPGNAEVALKYIGRLYKFEKFAREREISPNAIVSLRRERTLPVLEEFRAWMDKRQSQTPPGGCPVRH